MIALIVALALFLAKPPVISEPPSVPPIEEEMPSLDTLLYLPIIEVTK